jgi:hypothetical protein
VEVREGFTGLAKARFEEQLVKARHPAKAARGFLAEDRFCPVLAFARLGSC